MEKILLAVCVALAIFAEGRILAAFVVDRGKHPAWLRDPLYVGVGAVLFASVMNAAIHAGIYYLFHWILF